LLIDHPSPGEGDRQLANPALQGLEAIGDKGARPPPKQAILAQIRGFQAVGERQIAKLAGRRKAIFGSSSRTGVVD